MYQPDDAIEIVRPQDLTGMGILPIPDTDDEGGPLNGVAMALDEIQKTLEALLAKLPVSSTVKRQV